MIQTRKSTVTAASERQALRRRVRQMYDCFNREQWAKCFALIDPKLTAQGRVEPAAYEARLKAFKRAYGTVHPWHLRIGLHLDASSNNRDPRPFAYVYLVWQDDAHGFHMFRERWVKEAGRWYTRVVGLVPNGQGSTRPHD